MPIPVGFGIPGWKKYNGPPWEDGCNKNYHIRVELSLEAGKDDISIHRDASGIRMWRRIVESHKNYFMLPFVKPLLRFGKP